MSARSESESIPVSVTQVERASETRARHPPSLPRATADRVRRDDEAGAPQTLVGPALARRGALRMRVRRARRRPLPLRLRAPGTTANGVLRRLQGSRRRRAPRVHADLRAHARHRRRRDHRNVRGARRRNAVDAARAVSVEGSARRRDRVGDGAWNARDAGATRGACCRSSSVPRSGASCPRDARPESPASGPARTAAASDRDSPGASSPTP